MFQSWLVSGLLLQDTSWGSIESPLGKGVESIGDSLFGICKSTSHRRSWSMCLLQTWCPTLTWYETFLVFPTTTPGSHFKNPLKFSARICSPILKLCIWLFLSWWYFCFNWFWITISDTFGFSRSSLVLMLCLRNSSDGVRPAVVLGALQ